MRNQIHFVLTATLAGAAMFATASLSSAQTSPPKAPEAHSPAPEQKPPVKTDEPLSEKLNKNDGVLVPPSGVDPQIHKDPPPGTGDRMPVIVPPGEPGGDQQIQPK